MCNLKLTLIALCVASSLLGQKFSVALSPEFKTEKDVNFWGHLYSDASGHYVLQADVGKDRASFKNFTPVLEKYDRSFRQVFSKRIAVEEEVDYVLDFFYVRDQFLLSMEKLEGKAGKATFFVCPVDMGGTPGKSKTICEFPYANKDEAPTNSFFRISPDSTKLLFTVCVDRNYESVNSKLSLVVLDPQLNTLWKQDLVLPYTQEQMFIANTLVSNDGQVYILAKLYDEKKKEAKKSKGKEVPAYKMVLFHFDGKREKPVETVIGLPGKFVTGVLCKMAPNGDLYGVGFFSNDKRQVIQGMFFTRLNGQTGEVKLSTSKEFTAVELAGFDVEKDKAGDMGLESNYDLQYLIPREDGGMILLAEQVYVTSSVRQEGRRVRTIYAYSNNEILIANINPEGAIEKVEMVPKQQAYFDYGESNTLYFSSRGKYRMSDFNGYSLLVSGQNFYFFYNEDEDNIDRPLSNKSKRNSGFKGSALAVVAVSADGSMKRQKLIQSESDADALIVPTFGIQTGPNELFFLSSKYKLLGSKKMRMGLVTLK